MSLKVVSLNIEKREHLDRVRAFLATEEADIVCLMEVCEPDVISLAGRAYPYHVYAPNDIWPEIGLTGVAILSKQPIASHEAYYCDEAVVAYTVLPRQRDHAPCLVLAQIGEIQIGSVHFTWTPHGSVTEEQRRHVNKLLTYLASKGELVLAGDCNIPRGNEMYQHIVARYRDNIPAGISTTIDPDLHRANFKQSGKLALVVDYVWSTPTYRVSDVRVESGVSDHCAVVCEVERVDLV